MSVNIETFVERHLSNDHPLRKIKRFADEVLKSLDSEFDTLYAKGGRPSIPPEMLLLALLWQALFSIRSERQLEDTLRYDLRFRWFIGLPFGQEPWDHSTFSRARETMRLQTIAYLFFERHVEFLRAENLMSNEHLSVDGTLLHAAASHKSMIPRDQADKDGNPPPAPPGGRNGWVDFKGKKRSNETHMSATDPEARLASKGTGAKLSYELNVISENRNNLIVDFTVSPPTGTSEKEDALAMISLLEAREHSPSTLGADRKYSDGDSLVAAIEQKGIAAHFATRDDRPNALARVRQSDDSNYAISIRARMRIEEIFAFAKCVCGLAKLRVRGVLRVFGAAAVAAVAYNITRHATLAAH